MKMVKSVIEKKGNKAVLKAAFRDHMRRPKTLKIVVEDARDLDPQVVCETEDPSHMYRLLASFAELAWSRGWRPRGLPVFVAQTIQAYKEPPEEGTA
jgi:hypothetical protein